MIIYTDGACSGNPGPGGWASIILTENGTTTSSGCEQHTTNNRMELTAVIESLKTIGKKFFLESNCDVDLTEIITIRTDSMYVKQGITVWINNWLKNDWKTSNRKPVKNADLWLKLYKLTQNYNINCEWVKAHAGDIYNESVDRIARGQTEKRWNL